MSIKFPVYRCEWQSAIDGEWFPGSEWVSEIAEALEAQERWRELGYNTVVCENVREYQL